MLKPYNNLVPNDSLRHITIRVKRRRVVNLSEQIRNAHIVIALLLVTNAISIYFFVKSL